MQALWIAAAVAIPLAWAAYVLRGQAREARNMQMWQKRCLGLLDPAKSLQTVAAGVLELVAGMVKAPGYYLYLSEEPGDQLVLSAVRVANPGVLVGPHYSGLVQGIPEYEPPLTLPVDQLAAPGRQLPDLFTQQLRHPDGQLEGVIRMRLHKRDHGRLANARALDALAPDLARVLATMRCIAALHEKVEIADDRSRASSTAAQMALGIDKLLAMLLRLGGGLLRARAGLLVAAGGDLLHAWYGLDKEAAEGNRTAWASLTRQAVLRPVTLPTELARHFDGHCSVSAFKVGHQAHLMYIIPGQEQLNAHLRAAITTVAERLKVCLDHSDLYAQISQSYLLALQGLVDILDSRQPFHVGHSQRVAKHAREIALELGLPPREVQRIEQAALLHDVGMLALDHAILFKPGHLTDQEYMAVQQHPQTGAALLEGLPDAEAIASMVRHHHERWDGWGYPHKLAGETIPLGARILAVSDVFVAKLSRRSYRPGLSFDRALADISEGGGTRFDPVVTKAFVACITRQRRQAVRRRPLENCWQMRQCPESIRTSCPAYTSPDRCCWDVPGVSCRAHGDDTCTECFVWTEHQGRL